MLLAVDFIHYIKNDWDIFLSIRLGHNYFYNLLKQQFDCEWEKKIIDYCKSDYLHFSANYEKICEKICVHTLQTYYGLGAKTPFGFQFFDPQLWN